ncbi:MAG: hypothetical protein IT328_14025 [Caldilineaceae bacterium]|nr:hypothetical protein [Caldilineaceae bacterium]
MPSISAKDLSFAVVQAQIAPSAEISAAEINPVAEAGFAGATAMLATNNLALMANVPKAVDPVAIAVAPAIAVTPAAMAVMNVALQPVDNVSPVVLAPALHKVDISKFVRPNPILADVVFQPNRAILDAMLFPVFWDRPKPRSQMQVPIAPAGEINASTQFQDPVDGTKTYYIPTFNLAEQTEGDTRVRVLFEGADQNWTLTVHIVTGQRQPTGTTINHSVALALRFVLPSMTSITKEIPFVFEQEDPFTLKATCTLTGLSERDQVVQALTQTEYRTQVVARCTMNVAIPVEVDQTTGEQLYRAENRTVDVSLDRDPFLFDTNNHSYIFRALPGISQHTFGVIPRQVEYQGRSHQYYQDEANPPLFYYLPDSFKITRNAVAPFVPSLRVQFRSEDGTAEKMRYALEYGVTPVFVVDRLDKARAELKSFLPSPMPAGITEAIFQPLVVNEIEQLRYTVTIPRAGAAGVVREERAGLVKNLTDGFADILDDLSLENFQGIFDALFGKSAVILSGDVFVDGGGQRPDASITLVARLNDLYGPIFEEKDEAAADGTVTVTLTNRIESPVLVRSIPGSIVSGTDILPATLDNLAKSGAPAQFPVQVGAGEMLTFRLVPNQAPANPAQVAALYDLDDVEVQPDANAVWQAVLDNSVAVTHLRTIHVRTFAEWFAPTTDVQAIALDFADGDTPVVLTPGNLEAAAVIHMPPANIILRETSKGEYRYTMVVVRASGQQQKELTDRLDVLFPNPNT